MLKNGKNVENAKVREEDLRGKIERT